MGRSRGRLVIFDAYPHVYGGTTRMMHSIALGMRARGWHVEVVLPGAGTVAEYYREDGIDVTEVEAPSELMIYGGKTLGSARIRATAALPGYWRRLGRVLRERGDLVQTTTQRGVLLAGVAARAARVPLVWHIGGTGDSAVANALGGLLARYVIVVSAAALAENRGLPRWRAHSVIPNAFPPRLLDTPVGGSGGLRIASVVRLVPVKGVDVLLRAVAELRRTMPDVTATILGPGQRGHEAHEKMLGHLRAELGLEEHVEFAGFVEQPEQRWRDAAVYVQPSRREGFGVALVEAMATGMPVVATRVGGIPEIIDHEVSGLLVPPDDPVALAAAIGRLLRDRSLAARLARAARSRALAEYAPDLMVERYAAVYDSLLGRASSRR